MITVPASEGTKPTLAPKQPVEPVVVTCVCGKEWTDYREWYDSLDDHQHVEEDHAMTSRRATRS